MNIIEQKIEEKFGNRVEKSVLMKKQTTMGVGGIADYFFRAKKIEEIIEVCNFCYAENIPVLIIGWGSNLIVSDFGFNGMVVRNEAEGLVINRDRGEVMADSGVVLGKLLMSAASNDLGGIEFLAGIPGTLGGAINNNAGSKKSGIGDYVKSITCLEERAGELKLMRHEHDWMNFSYRESKLKSEYKNKKFKPVILTVKLRLTRKRKDEILRLIQENFRMKHATQPLTDMSAGSFFKNQGNEIEQSAGYLLDHSGAKKLHVGGAKVSPKHANFIINCKNASAEDIRRLADNMREAVKDNYHLTLEEEVEYVGKW